MILPRPELPCTLQVQFQFSPSPCPSQYRYGSVKMVHFTLETGESRNDAAVAAGMIGMFVDVRYIPKVSVR